jgi:hypothetical protein
MISWDHPVPVKRIEELSLPIFPLTDHPPLPLMTLYSQRITDRESPQREFCNRISSGAGMQRPLQYVRFVPIWRESRCDLRRTVIPLCRRDSRGRAMMGRLKNDQGQLFYEFRLGDAVPEDHMVSMQLSMFPGCAVNWRLIIRQ